MVMSVKLNRISKTKYFYNRTEESILYLKHLKALGGEGGGGGGGRAAVPPTPLRSYGTGHWRVKMFAGTNFHGFAKKSAKSAENDPGESVPLKYNRR